jgi:hypothetical protein
LLTGLRQAGQQMRGQTLRIEESAVGDIEGLAERIEDLTRSLQV